MPDQWVVPVDARVFLGRLTRLDPTALVRLRPAEWDEGEGTAGAELWGRLPWGVLVTRLVGLPVSSDQTVAAAALLTAGERWPPRQDPRWRWSLPPQPGKVLEELPAQTLRQVAAAAAGTLREVSDGGLRGRAVGARILRDALLDHVPIVVESGGERAEVPQRLVQAVLQMGFLGGAADTAAAATPVRVRQCDRWVGLAARYGTAWLPPPARLTLRPT